MKEQYGLTAQGEALLKSQEVGLFLNVQRGTIRPATAKSVAGIGVPFDLKRTNTRQRVFLCV